MKKIALFASGNGTNAQRIIEYFKDNKKVHVVLVASNKPDAFVLERAKRAGIPTFTFDKKDFFETNKVLHHLLQEKIDWIVLAGFLWKIPESLLKTFPDRIINIHPALLPKYGGKGMYGMKVHEAVIQNKEKESGINIHYVNEHYDEGKTIFIAKCIVNSTDTPETLANKIHALEHEFYPKVIDQLLT